MMHCLHFLRTVTLSFAVLQRAKFLLNTFGSILAGVAVDRSDATTLIQLF